MTNLLQRHRNISTIATVTSAITLSSTVSKIIAVVNPGRIFCYVNIDGVMGNNSIFIKLQAASVDNDKKGIWIGKQGGIFKVDWEMSSDNTYIGEISAIADSGTPVIFVTEY